ncbi:hypothetical protein HN419_04765 [Candidatus Woesearchaeota archaeon]|jgi:flagellin-like protein|nr:hypothetical protein [Candidatus Woesearchaeota archaeon]MBT3537812.1 hypothetical protein [Candidatus Woesearchaeota archaeon]MBT4697943.1 hypothetical protein [Candidatus Woesearchaeota archaeon]MBT7105481.1 hypothetical protein [Candidatus Woesearchaeota archaeon]MBT7931671.1 hypothetical protein [Candidatus Woesearchaeota archaeon]
MPRIFNKRAVSPLVATILLILFAIALGAIVMNVGKDYISKKGVEFEQKKPIANGNGCDGAAFKIVSIAGQRQLCYSLSDSDLEMVVESVGSSTISSLKIFVMGENTKEPETLFCDKEIPKAEANFFKEPYNSEELGAIKYAKITPVVGGKPCSSAAQEFTDIPAC